MAHDVPADRAEQSGLQARAAVRAHDHELRRLTLRNEDVARIAMQIDECLLRIYRHLADKAETESVRDVFRNLVTLEQGELRKLALNALRAGDV